MEIYARGNKIVDQGRADLVGDTGIESVTSPV